MARTACLVTSAPRADAAAGVMGALFVAGLSHHTAPVEVREQLALEGDKVREILVDLAARGRARTRR